MQFQTFCSLPHVFEKKEIMRENSLVYLLSHHVGPINHSRSEIEVNGAGTAGFIHDRNHAVVVVQSNLADVSFVCE